jgi:hypothetical protein
MLSTRNRFALHVDPDAGNYTQTHSTKACIDTELSALANASLEPCSYPSISPAHACAHARAFFSFVRFLD